MDGASFLLAGPGWKGATPRASRRFSAARPNSRSPRIRTQLFNPADIDKREEVQAGYKVQPLSRFLGQPHPRPRRPLISSNR
jgi:hypothetical protein